MCNEMMGWKDKIAALRGFQTWFEHVQITSKSRLAVDREFMYTGSSGPGRADGQTGGRTGGRAEGGRMDGRTILNDSTTIFIVVYKNWQKNVFFCRVASDGSASTDLYCKNGKKQKHVQTILCIFYIVFVFLTFQITRTRKYRFLLFKYQFLGTAPDPPDPGNPGKMEHELRLPNYQQRAGGQDDGSLNKLPQIKTGHF